MITGSQVCSSSDLLWKLFILSVTTLDASGTNKCLSKWNELISLSLTSLSVFPLFYPWDPLKLLTKYSLVLKMLLVFFSLSHNVSGSHFHFWQIFWQVPHNWLCESLSSTVNVNTINCLVASLSVLFYIPIKIRLCGHADWLLLPHEFTESFIASFIFEVPLAGCSSSSVLSALQCFYW